MLIGGILHLKFLIKAVEEHSEILQINIFLPRNHLHILLELVKIVVSEHHPTL